MSKRSFKFNPSIMPIAFGRKWQKSYLSQSRNQSHDWWNHQRTRTFWCWFRVDVRIGKQTKAHCMAPFRVTDNIRLK